MFSVGNNLSSSAIAKDGRSVLELVASQLNECPHSVRGQESAICNADRPMSVTLKLKGQKVGSFAELVEALPDDALAAPRRSTVPLVDYWREPERRIAGLWRDLGLQAVDSVEFHFEYATAVRAGSGKASFTDLMIVADNVAVAVEAKFTEPPYETVSSWLGKALNNNRTDVLTGWLNAISSVATKPITAEAVAKLPYQLIHRTASVCCLARPTRYVVYQIFGAHPESYYPDQLRGLSTVIGPKGHMGLALVECGLSGADSFNRLDARWHDGDRHLSAEIRRALLAGPMFDFFAPVLKCIRKAA
jgi:hypothetical protein